MNDFETILRGFAPAKAADAEYGRCDSCGEPTFPGIARCVECVRREERRRAAIGYALRVAGAAIPRSFAFARAGFDDETVRARIRDAAGLQRVRAAADGTSSLLLRGPAGAGKTTVAAVVAWARARQGIAPMWADVFELANAVVRAPIGRTPELVTAACTAPLLILDDLGSEPNVATSPISEVIHRRHANALATIVTTWADLAAIQGKYGDGIARRLHERAVVVELRAPKGGAA